MEAGLESGFTYNEAINMGFTKEEASEAANSVYWKNFALLTGTNVLEFGISFIPNPAGVVNRLVTRGIARPIISGGRVVSAALTESGQEFVQDIFTRQSLGIPVEWDDEAKMAVVMGGLLGGITAGIGTLTRIQNRTKDMMTSEQIETFRVDVEGFKEAGMSQNQAEMRAFDNLAATPEGKEIIEQAVEQVNREEIIKEIRPGSRAEQIAWVHIAEQGAEPNDQIAQIIRDRETGKINPQD